MTTPERCRTVAVVGNGLIGHGVAQVFATAGHDVRLIGRSRESLDRAAVRVRESLGRFVAHGLVAAEAVDGIVARVRPSTSLDDAAGADLVVEAVPEDQALEHAVFERLDRVCPPPAVLASSSGQPASRLVDRVRRRERVVAAHFWNPPQLIPLVEVCPGPETTISTDLPGSLASRVSGAVWAGDPVGLGATPRAFDGPRGKSPRNWSRLLGTGPDQSRLTPVFSRGYATERGGTAVA